MSVINQMLRDLQQRQQTSEQALGSSSVTLVNKGINLKYTLLIVFFTVFCCFAAVNIWQLKTENKLLKQVLDNKVAAIGADIEARRGSKTSEQSFAPTTEKLVYFDLVDDNQGVEQDIPITVKTLQKTSPEAGLIQGADNTLADKKLSSLIEKTSKVDNAVSPPPVSDQQAPNSQVLPDNQVISSATFANEQTSEQAKKQVKESQKRKLSSERQLAGLNANTQSSLITTKPGLAISRRQLSADDLVKQKMVLAEQAIINKELLVAEQLFEDILILTPEDEISRKQLAALWFGRQAYQPAINLLSQGISLNPEQGEFRLMQAKIYLNQGLAENAYQVLQVLAQTIDKEYQAILANVAQQTGRHQQAITAYQGLTQAQPGFSRWWLGLAIAYDSNSQFDLAIINYRTAVAKGNLSLNSAQFSQQRLQELGG